MSRFFVPREAVKGKAINISGKEAHHILDVMRLKEADKVVTFDGTGKEYAGFIKHAGPKDLTIEITESRTPVPESISSITLIQAIPKKDKMDYIVEKATELGVYSIAPVITNRTIVRWDAHKAKGIAERWRKIAMEASKQCGRTTVPAIDAVKDFDRALANLSGYDMRLIATLRDNSVSLKDAISGFGGGKIAVAIGPEGDFDPDEVAAAEKANFKPISLGRLVLKSDTAGLAAIAILNYELKT